MYDVTIEVLVAADHALEARRKVIGPARNTAAVYAIVWPAYRTTATRVSFIVTTFGAQLQIATGCRKWRLHCLTLGERNISVQSVHCRVCRFVKSFGIEEITHIVRHPFETYGGENRHSAT